MPSQDLAQIVNQQFVQDPFLFLLRVDDDDVLDDILLVNNNVAITSNGKIYQPFPFAVVLPTQDAETLPVIKLVISNADLALIRLFRQITYAPSIILEVVYASSPDLVEYTTNTAKLTNITYDATTISGDLTYPNLLAQSYPEGGFTPQNFPGLF